MPYELNLLHEIEMRSEDFTSLNHGLLDLMWCPRKCQRFTTLSLHMHLQEREREREFKSWDWFVRKGRDACRMAGCVSVWRQFVSLHLHKKGCNEVLWRWIERFEVSCDFALHVPQIHGYFLRDMCLEYLAKGVWSQLNIGRHLIVPFLRMIIGLLVHEHCCYETWRFFLQWISDEQMYFQPKKKTPALPFLNETHYSLCL